MTASRRAGAALALLAALGPAAAAPKGGGGLLPGSSGKEPVSIDAGRLDYFDKEQKLVYSGEVVARQGDSTLKASTLTIFLTRTAKENAGAAPAAGPAGSSIDRMEAKGPVTVTSKDDVGTGDSASYDKAANKVTLSGNVTLTQATNVIRGDRLVYDMNSGQAQVFAGQTQGRVRSLFTPGSSGTPGAAKKPAAHEGAPRTAAGAAPEPGAKAP